MPPPADRAICDTFPLPMAAAWAGVLSVGTDAECLLQILQVPEVVLRTLCALALPDYLRGAPDPQVEQILGRLEKPGHGQWVALLRHLVAAQAARSTPAPFLPQLVPWYLSGPRARPGEEAARIDRLIEARNRHAHKGTAWSQEGMEAEVRTLKAEVRALLQGLSWTADLPLIRVLSQEPTRQGTFRGRLQVYRGTAETPIAETAVWSARLLPGCLYLLDTRRTALLEVSPFLQVRMHGPTRQDRLHLLKAVRPGRGLRLSHDPTQADLDVPLQIDGAEASFEAWLQRRGELDPFQGEIQFWEHEGLEPPGATPTVASPEARPAPAPALPATEPSGPSGPGTAPVHTPGRGRLHALLGLLAVVSVGVIASLLPRFTSEPEVSVEPPSVDLDPSADPGSALEPALDPALSVSPDPATSPTSAEEAPPTAVVSTAQASPSVSPPPTRTPSSRVPTRTAVVEPPAEPVSTPAPEVKPIATTTGTVVLEKKGTVAAVALLRADTRQEVPTGAVAPGTYRVKADFGGAGVIVSDETFTVEAGQTLRVRCSSFNTRCVRVTP